MEHLCMVYGSQKNGRRKRINKFFESELIKGDKLSGAIEEWLDIKDAWEEDISEEIQPYRKRSEDIKISDQNN